MLALVLPDLEDRHDPRMVEVGGGLGLGVEPLDVVLIGKLAGQDHLEGDGAVEADLPGLEDDAHAAAGDLTVDLVVAEVAHAVAEGRLAVATGLAAGRIRAIVGSSCIGTDVADRPGPGLKTASINAACSGKRARVFLRGRAPRRRGAELALDAEQFLQAAAAAALIDLGQVILDPRPWCPASRPARSGRLRR